jgi:hypothetical protein
MWNDIPSDELKQLLMDEIDAIELHPDPAEL